MHPRVVVRRRLGLRLRPRVENARRLRGLPAPRDRGMRRATDHPHSAWRRVHAAGDVTLRARLALALAALTAAAVTAMALVGFRTTENRLYDELDRSLLSSSTRFADPDGNYARLVCNQLAQREPVDEGQRELADLPGTEVQCIATGGAVVAASSQDAIPVNASDVSLASRGGSATIRTDGDDRIVTVAVRG